MQHQLDLPGLFCTDNAEAAATAMFFRNFDIVILRHPDPGAFEAAMQLICNAHPEYVHENFGLLTRNPPRITHLLGRIKNNICWKNSPKKIAAARMQARRWFTVLKDVIKKANPGKLKLRCKTRSGHTYRYLGGFHADASGNILDLNFLPWRAVITLVGRGTTIIERKKLYSLIRNKTVAKHRGLHTRKAWIRARQEISLPSLCNPSQRKKAILARSNRVEELLHQRYRIVAARPGDIVFIAQCKPTHLLHASPHHTRKPRLGLVLDLR
ncbi:MAG: hypothetical protein EB059_02960 [Alphaproteobacteria bacterium]|nr:hypothetical protein [Alphaproteobacteria bacterium]